MLFSSITTTLKLLIIGILMAVELSVALPIISITALFLFIRELHIVVQSVFLVVGALLISSFTGLAWSLTFLILMFSWILIELSRTSQTHVRNRVILVSLMTTILISYLAGVTVTAKVITYTVVFCLVAFALVRFFWQGRSRHRLIEWISGGGR